MITSPSLCALRASARVRFARRGAEDAEGMHMREWRWQELRKIPCTEQNGLKPRRWDLCVHGPI